MHSTKADPTYSNEFKLFKNVENNIIEPRSRILLSNYNCDKNLRFEKSLGSRLNKESAETPWTEMLRLKKLCIGVAIFSDMIIAIWGLVTIFLTTNQTWLCILAGLFVSASFLFWALTQKRISLERYTLVLSIYASLFILLITEIAVHSNQPLTRFTMGISFQLNISLLFISRCTKKEGFFSTLFFFSYALMRLMFIPNNLNAILLYFSIMIALMIVNCVLFYLLSKEMILKNNEVADSQKSLESFKKLIKDVVPNALIIFQNEEIIFANNAAENLKPFGAKLGKDHIDLSIIKNIEIYHHQSLITYLDAIILEEAGVDRQQESTLNIPEKKELRLLELIKVGVQNPDSPHSDTYNKFTNLQGSVDILESESYKDDRDITGREYSRRRFYDIQIGNILWEQKVATLIVLSDITDAKRVDHLKLAGKLKDNLLATVSHDLRTPLNGIIGMLELSIEASQTEESQKLLSTALRASNMLHFMINDILDFSLITNGKLKLNKEIVELREIFKDVVSIIKFQAKRKEIEFKFDKEKILKSPLNLYTDANRVKQILLNLLGNALKFTEKGYVSLSIEEKYFQESEEHGLLIIVEDTGIGIKPEDQPRLFTLFGKLEQTDSRINKTGIGLGLAISQNLTKLLSSKRVNGCISVESTYGVGSKFYFPLFFGQEDADLTEIKATIHPLPYSSLIAEKMNQHPEDTFESFLEGKLNKKLLVLVVDDDVINLMVASNYLKSYKIFNYQTAKNGKEALKIITTSAQQGIFFDIILMDCNMPFLDGYEATQKLVDMASLDYFPLPHIIALTANAGTADVERCFQVGMHDYLYKPVKKIALEQKLKDFLKKSSKMKVPV